MPQDTTATTLKANRHFEQNVLVEEETQHTVIERRYNDGTVEYWSVMALGFQQGNQQGTAQIPFKIDVPENFDDIEPWIRLAKQTLDEELTKRRRRAAFENFDAAMAAAEDGAKKQVADGIAKQQRRERSKILLANAVPPVARLQ